MPYTFNPFTGTLDYYAVSSVSNSDGTLTISPTTGAVVASLNLSHANTWIGQQTFNSSPAIFVVAPAFSSMTEGSVLFAGTSGVLSQDNSNFFWDNSNNRLGVGIGAPTAAVDARGPITSVEGPYNGSTYVIAGENGSPTNYVAGDIVNYRVYARYYNTAYNVYFYSQNYAESGPINIVAPFSSVDINWDNAVDGTPVDYLLVRDYNGSGFVWSYNTGNTNYVLDDNGAGSVTWDASVPDVSVTTALAQTYTKLSYNDGSTDWGLYVGGPGYFSSTARFAGTVGINVAPGSTSKLTIKNTEHSSASDSELSIVDSNGREVFGAAAWNGGGGTGGYGANVVSGYCTGAAQRMGEVGGKNTFNSYRLGDLIFQTGSAADKGEIAMITGSGSGSFVYGIVINEFGRVGIRGVTSPTANLHLLAGTTTASTAPLKFNSGSLLTSAEAGAVEFLTDKFYATITTGAARKELTLNDAALTSGRVPFATTNGRLTDDADLTFATDTLSFTKGVTTVLTHTANAGGTTDGMSWNDTTQKSHAVFESGIKQMLSGVIFTQTADQTIANTVTETTMIGTGVGTLTLPANFFVAGKTIRIKMSGVYSTVAITGDTITIKVKYGSTVITTKATSSLLTGATNLSWWGEIMITCRTTGSSGTVQSAGSVRYQITTVGGIAEDELNNGAATTTINTTTSNALDVTVTHGAANASNTIKSLVTAVEILN